MTKVQRLGHCSENITARNPKVLPFLVYTSCLYTFVRADLACSRLRDSRVRWIEKAQTRNFSRAFFFRVFPTICTSLEQASADLIQAEASWKLSSTSEWLMFAWENVSLIIKEVTRLCHTPAENQSLSHMLITWERVHRPPFSLQSPSSARDKKQNLQGIYWPPAHGGRGGEED